MVGWSCVAVVAGDNPMTKSEIIKANVNGNLFFKAGKPPECSTLVWAKRRSVYYERARFVKILQRISSLRLCEETLSL